MKRGLLLALAVLLLLPGSAWAHAVVKDTVPARGAALKRAPERVEIRFSEPVETRFGAMRVYAADGERVDAGDLSRPASDRVSVALRGDLEDGPYTATFRVVSADAHPVSGGYTFTVGRAGGTAAASVSDLIEEDGAGRVTSTAFGVARAVGYGATALLVGGALFLVAVWLPARRSGAIGDQAAARFASRARAVGLAAAAAGAAATLAGIVLQGATAAGTSFWSALEPSVIEDVLGTRFGTMWGLRLAAFVLLGGLLWLAAGRARSGAVLALGATALLALVLTPALAGHAGADDSPLLVPADAIHVAAMSTWVGGIALLLLALPAATRAVDPPERSGVLTAVLDRFSVFALAAVAALVATGIAQSIVHLDSLRDLTETAFGRALVVKAVLLVGLIALGVYQRRRALPGLRRMVSTREAPGTAGVSLRRALRAEVVLMAAALAVTAALVSYPPGAQAVGGPFAADRELGPARLELTVDPARVGRNEIHLYLFDRRTGAQFERFDELTVEATQGERRIGPIELKASETGPGHYTVRAADLAPAGDWELDVAMRIGEFDRYEASVEVPVR